MKCKNHVTDLSSTIGVCASCLRERLFVIIAAQAQAQVQHPIDDRQKFDPNPPPLVFPRSVSPYISRRKCDPSAVSWQDNQQRQQQKQYQSIPAQRFYSTPQVGPNGNLVAAGSYKKRNGIRFSLFANLFRSKSEKVVSDISGCGPISNFQDSGTDSSSFPSRWLSSKIPSHRKKQSRTFSVDESVIGGGQRRVHRHPDRGMSPARFSDDEDEHCFNGSSGYSPESSQPWKQTPRKTPAHGAAGKRGGPKTSHHRSISGMGFCLSPLVRPSPSTHWNQKGIPPDTVVAGEFRMVPLKPHQPNTTSFCKNRSRKLADVGRFH